MAWLLPEPERQRDCADVLHAAEEGKLEIVTSTITLTEVIKLKGRLPISDENRAKISRFFQNLYIVLYSLTRFIGDDARELIWKYSHLWPKDSIHLATAIRAGIKEIHSYDGDFLALDGKLEDPGIRIVRPRADQPSLPFPVADEEDEVDELEPVDAEEMNALEEEGSDEPN